uniref:Uncharacterized protein n=1 Tax=Chelydra serpentina TaxID=8475 RepID=A0A8C3RWF8_CHESE
MIHWEKDLGLMGDKCWRNCGGRGNFMHIKWTCPIVSVYWDEIGNQISQIVGYLLPNNRLVILLGFSSRNGELISYLLVAAQLLIASPWKTKNS